MPAFIHRCYLDCTQIVYYGVLVLCVGRLGHSRVVVWLVLNDLEEVGHPVHHRIWVLSGDIHFLCVHAVVRACVYVCVCVCVCF